MDIERRYRKHHGTNWQTKCVEVRIAEDNSVWRHVRNDISEHRADRLIADMQAASVHDRTRAEMEASPHWAEGVDVWSTSSHRGRVGAGMYYYSVVGSSKESLEAWKEDAYRSFHPLGYGTSIRIADEPNAEGLWTASGSRAGSCD